MPSLNRFPTVPVLALALALPAWLAPARDASAASAGNDAWRVRATGSGARRVVESFSDVNVGKPAREAAIRTRPIAERRRGDVAIRLLGDAATAAAMLAPGNDFGRELDKALEWLDRLAPPARPKARIELTLVDDTRHDRLRRSHAGRDITIVDLLVPVAARPASTRSTQVGQALAIALHEASHATAQDDPARARESRQEDEYRASLVEACYLIDTMRIGDILQLRARADGSEGAAGGEHFVAAQSRQAARQVMRDLAKAAGGSSVAWNDHVGRLGLKTLCAVRLAS